MACHVVIVEGLIASGKTTLTKELGQELQALTLLEPDEKQGANPYLARYYEDPARWALTMQLHLLGRRFEMHSRAQWHALNGAGHVLLDRSYYGDTAFALLQLQRETMTPEEFETYRALYRAMTAHVMYPSICIHLQTPPEVALDRVASRKTRETGRMCEAGIPLDYLQGLDQQISMMVKTLKGQGVHVIEVPWGEHRDTKEERAPFVKDLAQKVQAFQHENPFLTQQHRRVI